LRKWAESNNLLSDYQFGFRKDKSTTDCIFVLTSIINKIIKQEKRKLYVSMIDFRKCFDMLYRNGIWYKLIVQGVSTKIVKILRSIYLSVKACVRSNGALSENFDTYMGVKQGEPLSPLLFIFFVNDMYESLNSADVPCFTLDEMQIFLLLFADDLALFSYTEEGLQLLLNKLAIYCYKWGVTVNTDKTVVMVFKTGNRPEHVQLFYDNKLLAVVKHFTYLGVNISSNGNYYRAQKSLSDQALKALFSLNFLFDEVSLSIPEKLKLFDAMISPILFYGSEVWGFHKAPDIERVHLKFLKQLLGVKVQTTNSAVFGEFGRFPFEILRKVRIVKYWYRILQLPDSFINKMLFLKDVNGIHINSWFINLKSMLNELGFSYLCNKVNIEPIEIQSVIQRIYDQYLQNWCSELDNFSKLDSYKLFKCDFVEEKYLSCIENTKHRIALSRFRCSSHKLAIEEGRFRNIERNNRLCTKCNQHQIENEYHFLLICPKYRTLRTELIKNYYISWPNHYKFKALLQTKSKKQLNNLGKFIFLAMEKRNADG
jgi:hypothetical protein